MKYFLFILACLGLTSCMSTRIHYHSEWKRHQKPSYEDYFDYYLFGLVGHNRVSLQRVCLDQKPHGVQTIISSEDGWLTLVTLGIYSPMTVRVWCGD